MRVGWPCACIVSKRNRQADAHEWALRQLEKGRQAARLIRKEGLGDLTDASLDGRRNRGYCFDCSCGSRLHVRGHSWTTVDGIKKLQMRCSGTCGARRTLIIVEGSPPRLSD